MSNMKENTADAKQLMDNLQDELDFAVFEQEEMDPEKVREILARMESMDPEADLIKTEFDKDLVWKRIQEQCREEMAEESTIDFEPAKVGMTKKARKGGAEKAAIGKKNSGKVRRIALTAATIVVAVFVGANIGTYATEKKNVIEYMQDLNNGTSFWVSGDAPSMETEQNEAVYYSWNDVPDEYKKLLILPQGLPDDMGLYDISVWEKETADVVVVRYVDDEAKRDLFIRITSYEDVEFTFANYMYEERYELLEKKMVKNEELCYYVDELDEVVAQYMHGTCAYTFSGTLDEDIMRNIVEKTIESNF